MIDKLQLSVPNFEPSENIEQELCIEMGINYFQYAVIAVKENAVKAIASKNAIIFNEIQDSLLQSHYSTTKISMQTQKFTFIPSEIFTSSHLAVYAKYLQADETQQIAYHEIKNTGITIIYALPKLTLDKLGKHFPDATYFPQMAPLLTAISEGFLHIDFPQLFLNFRPGFIEIAIYHKKTFKFYNIFEYQNDDELMYFVLLSIQQNNLNLADTTLKIAGHINAKSEIYQRLQEHFPRMEATDQDCLPLTYQDLGQPVMPRFFSLFSLHLCESSAVS